MVEVITCADLELAIILRRDFQAPGIQFFTPSTYSQQLGYMKRPTGYVIGAHVHKPVAREVEYTKEVLVIKSGKVRVDFYDEAQVYQVSKVLEAGDIILLARGGHGFEILEEAEIIEIKQGPYAGEEDKVRFTGIDSTLARIDP